MRTIYKMRISVILAVCFFYQSIYAQLPNDCVNAITVCGNGIFSSNANGIGNTQEVSGCSGMEHNSIWLKINVVQSGDLGFHIRPNNPDILVDYDFWVYGANRDCSNLGAPIRCATTNPNEAGLTSNHTGMYGSTTQTQVGPGANGNGYVRWLTVTAGQSYYIAIDRPEGDGGFELEWIGSATNGTGAFSPPPIANSIPDYLTCSVNPNVGIFDFNSVRSSINPDLVNNTINFFGNNGDAVDNTNPLPNIIANTENPQEIFARVTDNTTGCFSITSFNLQVFPIPTANISLSDTSMCSREAVTITFNGTPNSVLEYQINGGASQFVTLDNTGIFSFTDSPLTDTTYTLVDASIQDANNMTVCSQAVNETVSVTVNEITAPTVTSNGPLCEGEEAQFTFAGDAGAEINFLLNGVATVVTLDASGHYLLTVANVQETVEVELLNMELPTAPFCTLDLTGANIEVTVHPLPMYEEPTPKKLCDFNNPGDEQELFLLDVPEIILGQDYHAYSFHVSLVDAQNNVNALEGDLNNPNHEVSFINTSNPQIIYIRAESEATGCYRVLTLELTVLPIPVALQPSDLIVCDGSTNDGLAIFNLTDVESEVLGTQNPDDFSISYYLSQAEAEISSTPISSPEAFENTVIGSQTIYARVENNGDSDCYAITSFDILVNASLNATFEMTANCDGATATILGDTGGTFSFYQTPTDGAVINAANGEITNATQGATYIVAYTLNGADCSTFETVSVTINTIPNVVTPSNLQQCGVVSDGAWFDLNSKISEITSNDTTLSVSFYLTQILAELGNPSDALPSPYLGTSANQTIYVRVEGNSGCVVYTELVLELFDAVQITQLPEISECDDDNNGIATFNLTPIESLLGTNPNWVISYHTTLNDAQNGTNSITNTTNYSSTTATVYVRIINTLDTNGFCNTILPLDLQVQPSPTMAISEITICEAGSTGFEAFDLQAEIQTILGNSQSSSNFEVHFFTDNAATNEITVNPFTNTIANAQTIYVQISHLTTNCEVLFPLDLIVLSGPQLLQPTDMEFCDDVSNDGIATFDLTSVEPEMLNSQNPDEFLITYHYLFNEAQNGTNAIANPQEYQNLSSPFEQIIYIRVQRLDSPDCISTTQVQLVVNPLMQPEVISVDGSNTICVDFNTNELQSGLTLTTNLLGANYTYQWFLNGSEIPGATADSYEITTASPGLYSVYVVDTNSDTSCGEEALSNSFEVIQSGLASLVSVTTSQPFANNQSITVTVQGYGDYWFQLNDGTISDNNGVFNNVAPGIHTVTVYDRKTDNPSCGFIIIEDIQIIDYPKFFTPNNDGYHDTWNITAMQHQPNSNILIYDRYGKILTYIKPYGPGWDGTYNGQRMMSTDYWFVLTYFDDDGKPREFKAHFALKR